MKTININSNYAVGKQLKAIKKYTLGSLVINKDEIGEIIGFRLMDLPDLMLWGIKVWDVDFDGKIISASEDVLKIHMRLI
jgi:hypothetical protein